MLSSFRLVSRFVSRLVAKKGMADAVIEFAEFAASVTKSKEDDKVVAKVKKAMASASPKKKSSKK